MANVIEISNLSKKYLLYHQGQASSNSTFVETLSHHTKNLMKRLRNPLKAEIHSSTSSYEEFWALKDVSLKLKKETE